MSMNSSKRQRRESDHSLATLSAVAAATSVAESKSNNLTPSLSISASTSAPSTTEACYMATTSISKEDGNQLHPMYGVQPFIAKLYQMINSCDKEAPYIASWDDNGQTFVVKDTKAFASQIMPNYMQTKQFDSFIRNLNFYDFHKIHALPIPKNARDPGTAKHVKYRHPNFQRNKMDLIREIKRSTRKVRNAAAQQEKDVEEIKHQMKEFDSTMKIMITTFQKEMNKMNERLMRLEDLFHSHLLPPPPLPPPSPPSPPQDYGQMSSDTDTDNNFRVNNDNNNNNNNNSNTYFMNNSMNSDNIIYPSPKSISPNLMETHANGHTNNNNNSNKRPLHDMTSNDAIAPKSSLSKTINMVLPKKVIDKSRLTSSNSESHESSQLEVVSDDATVERK